MAHTLDHQICMTVDSLSQDFFSALKNGSSDILSFVELWASFSNKIQSYRSSLTTETLDRVYAFASTLDVVANGMVDFHTSSDSISNEVVSDVTRLLDEGMAGLSLQDDPYSPEPQPEKVLYPSSPYIELASKWLVENLSNPYPSGQIKESIATQSQCPRKDIDHWFIDARRRIGWNELRKSHFNNKRADIVLAAQSFFGELYTPTTLSASVENAFSLIELNVCALHDTRYKESRLASELNSVLKDLTPQMKEVLSAERKERQLEERQRCKSTKRPRPYPTPEHSPERLANQSPLPSPSENLQAIRPLKRRRSSTEPLSEIESAIESPSKRSRAEDNISSPLNTGLPSPALSVAVDEWFDTPEELNLAQPSLPAPPPTNKRKRRLSDAGSEQAPKRPHNMHPSGRPQSVSNPFPVTSSFAAEITEVDNAYDPEWFAKLLGSMPPLDAELPSIDLDNGGVSLDMGLFNFDIEHGLGLTNLQHPVDGSAATTHPIGTLVENALLLPNPGEAPLEWLQPTARFNESTTDADALSQQLEDMVASTSFLPLDMYPPSAPTFWTSPSELNLVELPSVLPITTATVPLEIPTTDTTPTISSIPQTKSLTEDEKLSKTQKLLELEAQWLALRAELSGSP